MDNAKLANLNKKQNNSENLALKEASAYAYGLDIDNAECMFVPKLRVRVVTGHGTTISDEQPIEMFVFRREWICKHDV